MAQSELFGCWPPKDKTVELRIIGIHGGGEGKRTWTGMSFQVADVIVGARKILGCDFDDRCVRTAKENTGLNDLTRSRFVKADVLRWKPPASAGKPARYDIVAANLYSTILTAAAPMITETIRPRGALILSGILSVEESALKKIFSSLRHQQTLRRGKWSAMMFRKKNAG